MIVQKHAHETWCISQLDHAKLASDLLIQLNNYQKLPPKQKKALYHAARFHDHGWKHYDTNPMYKKNSTIPLDFTEISTSTHIEIWTASRHLINTKEKLSKYLICTHNIYLANIRASNTDNHVDKKKLSNFLTTEKEIQYTLKQALKPLYSKNTLDELSHLLKLVDWMSLTVCLNKKIPYVSFSTNLNISNYPKIKCEPSLNKTPITFNVTATKICSKSQKIETSALKLTFN
jgi:hypothetical protein